MSGRIFSRAWAKPLLKWAGGKTQLLEELTRRFPPELEDGHLRRYVEPFIGGGAVFFHVVQRFRFEECHIWDINEELVLAYRVVKQAPDQLISALRQIQDHYLRLPDEERERFYYNHRRIFNDTRSSMDFSRYSSAWVSRASQLFFLNRTCYNGLYRVNRNGDFNVPYGRYRNPRILDEENIRRASGILAGAHIHQGDFGDCLRYAGSDTFVYLDPPYRPVSRTSSFTAYVQHGFTDQDQVSPGFSPGSMRKGRR